MAGQSHSGHHRHPRHDLAREPEAFEHEIEFILKEAGNYLCRRPTRADVRSIWVGMRPLVKPQDDDGENTKKISREHTVMTSKSGSSPSRWQVDHLPRHGRRCAARVL
jgi:Glycerol-3-phosphate dehydrogenase